MRTAPGENWEQFAIAALCVMINQRLPSRSDLFSVYSVIVFWAYTWYMLMFFYKLPSWMLEVGLGEILAYFSYGILWVFLDSVQFLLLLTIPAILLPSALLRDDFPVSGSAAAGPLFFWTAFVQLSFPVLSRLSPIDQALMVLVILSTIIVSIVVFRRLLFFRNIMKWFISSVSIFVYLYIPLTVMGFLVILVRNLG